MRLDDADDYVFAAAFTPDALTQHAEGLAYAGRVAEEDFEAPALAFGCVRLAQEVFRIAFWIGDHPYQHTGVSIEV